MATPTITWKNNSTDQSPTGTKIERYEDFPPGHEHASAPVEVANGNTGGLDPTQANGTYVDSSISGGKYYSYAVSTLKGDEVATGVPTAEEWVADQANDIGYPGGVPATASTYNCSVAPFLHLDMDRIKGYKSTISMNQGTSTDFGSFIRIVNGVPGIFRANTLGFQYVPVAFNSTSIYNSDLQTDGDGISTLSQMQNGSYKMHLAQPNIVYIPDGFTIFRVMSGSFMTDGMLGEESHVHKSTSGPDGETYADNKFTYNKITMWGSTSSYTLTTGGSNSALARNSAMHPNSQYVTSDYNARHGDAYLFILAMRFNNTVEAYNTGTIKAQAFSAGAVLAETANVADKSYHNTASSNTFKYGAMYYYTGSTDGTGANCISLFENAYKAQLAGDQLLFDTALSLDDMNQVFGYLCNKYGVTQQVISASDLVN